MRERTLLFLETISLRAERYLLSESGSGRLSSSFRRISEGMVCLVSSSRDSRPSTPSILLISPSLGPIWRSANVNAISLSPCRLYSHYLLLLCGNYLIYLLVEEICLFLDICLSILAYILWKALLLELLVSIHNISASAAYAQFCILALCLCLLYKLPAALLCKRRNVDSDLLSVIYRSIADICIKDSLLYIGDHLFLPRLDKDCLCIRNSNACNLRHRCRRAIVIDHNIVENCRIGLACTEVPELLLQMRNCLVHLLLSLGDTIFRSIQI